MDESFENHLNLVYQCDFQAAHDANSDRQPDGWRRRRDRNHPAYIPAEIVSKDPSMAVQARHLQVILAKLNHTLKTRRWDPDFVPETIPPLIKSMMDGAVLRNCYEVRIDGGAFELVSPRFPIDSRLSYRLRAEACCQALVGYSASIELHILDSSGESTQSVSTRFLSGDADWQLMESDVIAHISGNGPVMGEVHLRIQPKQGAQGQGVVRFDNIQVHQLPRVALTTDQPLNIAQTGKPFQVEFQAIGLSHDDEVAHLQLLDIDDNVMMETSVPIQRTEVANGDLKFSAVHELPNQSESQNTATTSAQSAGEQAWVCTQATCPLTLHQSGYYRMRIRLGTHFQREAPLVVLEPSRSAGSPFGWTFTSVNETLQSEPLVDLIERLGIGWIKIPIWFEYRNSVQMNSIVGMLTRLKKQGMVCVGVLDVPHEIGDNLVNEDSERHHPIAILCDRKVWSGTVEPVLTSLGMRIDWLQLGNDDDRSLSRNALLRKQLQDIRDQVHAIGQDFSIAVGWDWSEPVDSILEEDGSTGPAWNALHFTSESRLTATELSEHAESYQQSSWKNWTTIRPLAASRFPVQQRTLDLVEQMIAVRKSGIQAAFANVEFDDEYGLLDSHHRAGQLVFPWTQISNAIGNRKYAGSICFPKGSTNHVFDGDAGTTVILWNEVSVHEQVFLGENTQIKDVWGRPIAFEQIKCASGSIAQEIPLGDWPLIATNVDHNIVAWQQQFELLTDHLSSQLADGGDLSFRVVNTLGQATTGRLTVHADSFIASGSVSSDLEMAQGSSQKFELPFTYRPDAATGKHSLEFAFDIQSHGQRYQFSIQREVRLGHRDLELKWELSRLNDQLVEVQVEVTNNTSSPVSFDCKLFPVDASYERVQVIEAPVGNSVHHRRLPIARSSTGKEIPVWVRCEQIGTPLVFNYRITE